MSIKSHPTVTVITCQYGIVITVSLCDVELTSTSITVKTIV